MKWARKFISDTRQGSAPKKAGDILAVGEVIFVRQANAEAENVQWHLSQVPSANTAFIAMNPENGAVISLVGGFNFEHNKFNRVTQSVRQVGSSIKPFIYSAGIDSGLTLASLINDAPINQWDESQGTAWRPKNSPPTYVGPTRLKIGLAQSKNVMAVRVLREVGLEETRQYLTRFGFNIDELPHSETIALGAGSLTPMQVAQGYSVFANGGYYVEPFYISKIEGPYGDLEFEAQPKTICKQDCAAPITPAENEFQEQDVDVNAVESPYAPQVISEQTAFLVREMMYSNIWGGGDWRAGSGWNGTGWRARTLKRRDIGGKTGTTNDSKDAWYAGYAPGVVAVSWVGFDSHNRTLGRTRYNSNLGKKQITGGEAGSKTAQPVWIDFMHTALEGVPEERKQAPSNIVRVRIDRESGLLTRKKDSSSMFEYFLRGTEPREYVSRETPDSIYMSEDGSEELF